MINNLKHKINKYKKSNFVLFCFFNRLRLRPYLLGLDFLFCYFYSLFISYKLFGFSLFPKVFFSSDVFRVIVVKSAHSKISTNAKMAIIFESFQHGVDRTVITLSKGAHLHIGNKFHIGNGCVFSLSQNASLTLVGELNNCLSGITCQTKILCSSNIHIGGG